jgi:uncharacterized protein (TIGR03435 family)
MLLESRSVVSFVSLKERFRHRRALVPGRAIVVGFALATLAVTGVDAQNAPSANIEKLPSFEVAAVKPSKTDDQGQRYSTTNDRFSMQNFTLRRLILVAYGLKSESQITGGPDWMDKPAFDIVAKIDETEAARIGKLKRNERLKEFGLLLQSLLADRFHLQVHQVERVMPAFALVVANSGAKLAHSPATQQRQNFSSTRSGHLEAKSISMDAFADHLTMMQEAGEKVVLNRTGLEGDYDFKLDWAPDYGSGVPPDAAFPGLLTALQEQLGLKLESQKGSIEVIVVDTATKPTLD